MLYPLAVNQTNPSMAILLPHFSWLLHQSIGYQMPFQVLTESKQMQTCKPQTTHNKELHPISILVVSTSWLLASNVIQHLKECRLQANPSCILLGIPNQWQQRLSQSPSATDHLSLWASWFWRDNLLQQLFKHLCWFLLWYLLPTSSWLLSLMSSLSSSRLLATIRSSSSSWFLAISSSSRSSQPLATTSSLSSTISTICTSKLLLRFLSPTSCILREQNLL